MKRSWAVGVAEEQAMTDKKISSGGGGGVVIDGMGAEKRELAELRKGFGEGSAVAFNSILNMVSVGLSAVDDLEENVRFLEAVKIVAEMGIDQIKFDIAWKNGAIVRGKDG